MKRAVVYCRCSTTEESQQNALVQQVAEAKGCVEKQNWILVDEYVELRSGTTSKRSEYSRLCEDMSLDKFDIIVIKSQDRLMRSTKDWYLFIDKLVSLNKKLYIYLESKFYTPDEALITGIKAILAEEYSRELSKKINNAHTNRQKNNGNVILTSRTYGYKKLPDKTVVLVEEEAKVKKYMYELAAAGYGMRSIANILKNEGITNRQGQYFNGANIGRMIRNPLNMGTVVMNKKHFDFNSKRTLKVPKEQQYVYKDKVPATVSEELWIMANDQMNRRSKKNDGQKVGYNVGNSSLSGKLECGICGGKYYRGTRRRSNQDIVYEWKCNRYIEVGRNSEKLAKPKRRKVPLDVIDGCDNIHLDELALYEFLENVVKDHYSVNRERIVKKMMGLLKQVFKERDIQSEVDKEEKQKNKILSQMDALVEKLLDGVLTDEVYKRKHEELQKRLEEINDKLKSFEANRSKVNTLKERMDYIESTLMQGSVIEKASISEMLDEIDKIRIYPTYMELRFAMPKLFAADLMAHSKKINESCPENLIRIDYGNYFNYKEKKKEQREKVVDLMRANPKITAKMIAKELNLSISGANYQIRALKRDGRIWFDGKGGHGMWRIEEKEE